MIHVTLYDLDGFRIAGRTFVHEMDPATMKLIDVWVKTVREMKGFTKDEIQVQIEET